MKFQKGGSQEGGLTDLLHSGNIRASSLHIRQIPWIGNLEIIYNALPLSPSFKERIIEHVNVIEG